MNKDIIILGSSRGARAVLADQMNQKTGAATYNLCYPGSDITFHNFLLDALIKHNTPPKKVILVVDDYSELHPDKTIKYRYDRLYPLVKYNYINQELITKNKNNILSWAFALSRGNSTNLRIIKKKFTANDTVLKYGSMPYTYQRKNKEFNYINTPIEYNTKEESSEKLNAFLSFQETCVKNNIKLILAFPPNLRVHNLTFERRIRSLAHPKTGIFIYNRDDFAYKDKSFYYDGAHLKINGAEIFTNELSNFIKTH